MKIKNIFIIVLLLGFLTFSAYAEGEENVRKVDANGTIVPTNGVASSSGSSDSNTEHSSSTPGNSDNFFGITKGTGTMADLIKAPLEGIKWLSGIPVIWAGAQFSTGSVMALGVIVCVIGIWLCVYKMGKAAWLKNAIKEIVDNRKLMFEIVIGLVCALGLTAVIVFISENMNF